MKLIEKCSGNLNEEKKKKIFFCHNLKISFAVRNFIEFVKKMKNRYTSLPMEFFFWGTSVKY